MLEHRFTNVINVVDSFEMSQEYVSDFTQALLYKSKHLRPFLAKLPKVTSSMPVSFVVSCTVQVK